MPAIPRWNKKAEKIAYAIMGKPDNSIDDASPKQKKIKKSLIYEEGQWAR
jgi:hypothetical protein